MLAEFGRLWSEAEGIWDKHQHEPAFHGYVSADYRAIYESLVRLQGRVTTVLEWGSGLGVVAIMASRMGFDAYGIESEPILVDFSVNLAQKYGPMTQLAEGSFIPDQFEWNPADGSEVNRTMIDVPAAYADLDMELRDFDLVYAYPWPNEHSLFQTILRQFGNREALLLTYDVREGVQLVSCGD